MQPDSHHRHAHEYSVKDLMMQLTPDLRQSYESSILTAVEAAVDPDLGFEKSARILKNN